MFQSNSTVIMSNMLEVLMLLTTSKALRIPKSFIARFA